MKTVYYAHCKSIYGTPQERRDIATLEAIGFKVENPSSPCHASGWASHGMDYARSFAEHCDAIAFRSLPDGSISAGVFKEIALFRTESKPVIELPSQLLRRELSLEQTREYLSEVGER